MSIHKWLWFILQWYIWILQYSLNGGKHSLRKSEWKSSPQYTGTTTTTHQWPTVRHLWDSTVINLLEETNQECTFVNKHLTYYKLYSCRIILYSLPMSILTVLFDKLGHVHVCRSCALNTRVTVCTCSYTVIHLLAEVSCCYIQYE